MISEKTPLSMAEIENRLSEFQFPEIEIVVGIASGGAYPAKMIAKLLNKPLSIIEINFRSSDNSPLYDAPQLIKMEKMPPDLKKMLLEYPVR